MEPWISVSLPWLKHFRGQALDSAPHLLLRLLNSLAPLLCPVSSPGPETSWTGHLKGARKGLAPPGGRVHSCGTLMGVRRCSFLPGPSCCPGTKWVLCYFSGGQLPGEDPPSTCYLSYLRGQSGQAQCPGYSHAHYQMGCKTNYVLAAQKREENTLGWGRFCLETFPPGIWSNLSPMSNVMSLFGLVFSRLQVCPFLYQALETLSPGTLASSRRSHSPCSNLVAEGVADEVLL